MWNEVATIDAKEKYKRGSYYRNFYVAPSRMTEVSAVINETHLEQQNFEEIYIHGLDAKRGKNFFIFKLFDKIEPITGIVNLYHLMHISIPIIQKLQERALDVIT